MTIHRNAGLGQLQIWHRKWYVQEIWMFQVFQVFQVLRIRNSHVDTSHLLFSPFESFLTTAISWFHQKSSQSLRLRLRLHLISNLEITWLLPSIVLRCPLLRTILLISILMQLSMQIIDISWMFCLWKWVSFERRPARCSMTAIVTNDGRTSEEWPTPRNYLPGKFTVRRALDIHSQWFLFTIWFKLFCFHRNEPKKNPHDQTMKANNESDNHLIVFFLCASMLFDRKKWYFTRMKKAPIHLTTCQQSWITPSTRKAHSLYHQIVRCFRDRSRIVGVESKNYAMSSCPFVLSTCPARITM
jgi:hypothetical protein